MIVPLDPSRPLLREDGTMQDVFRRWTEDVSRLSIIIGTGSPEGIIQAIQGQEYMDDAGVTSAIKYIKRDADIAGDTKQGWILI